ncbi:MAG: hypothetical protein DHS20C05_11560 [Hyphococcus sp.]|nr:MAG: hypothetical protein DHS20C05_11560 [Marinicaulis sp.]
MTSCSNSQADERGAKQAIVPEGMEWAVEQFGFSPAVRAGDFLYLSGIVAGLPQDEDGVIAPATEENLTAAYEQAFAAIGTVLAAGGADFDDVVDITTYHTDLAGQVDTIMVVKNRYIKAPHPAWTAIDIDRLFIENGVTEIKITAYAPLNREK